MKDMLLVELTVRIPLPFRVLAAFDFAKALVEVAFPICPLMNLFLQHLLGFFVQVLLAYPPLLLGAEQVGCGGSR